MRLWKGLARGPSLVVTLVVLLSFAPIPEAQAAINSQNLGAKYDATLENITFRVYSSRATRVEVWIYGQGSGVEESARQVMTRDDATGVWSQTVSVSDLRNTYGITGTVYYGYRAWGPNWPYEDGWTKGSETGFIADVDAAGNRFNPNKLLLDPYALEISQDPLSGACADGMIHASGALDRHRDSGACASKGIVLAPDTEPVGIRPSRALKDEVIYEVHVRGLTMNDTSLPETLRGTYAGAATKAGYLAELGITAVEFLPVQELQNDTNDVDPNSADGDNYWGYATLNYFAPDRRYASDKSPGGPTREWKAMVKAFHDAGIKVYVDVVYNHTGEGAPWANSDGQTVYNLLSWRGLDNPTYYSLTSDLQSPWDNTGMGGNYNTRNVVAQNLIIDSLAYWRDTLGVDGFRFDLASVLGNTCEHGCFNFDRTDSGNALNRIVAELPPRPAEGGAGIDLIAEPWAFGDNAYQVGDFPAGWAEWNGIFRDRLRRKQNNLEIDVITTAELSHRFAGSPDLYGDDGRSPGHSINYLVAHDGFTLNDLYAYNAKQNDQPWPYGPSDGGDDHNNSWDQGGDRAEQRKAARTGLAFLMLSAGVPMFTGGDEVLRTQYGNNNTHNLDSSANWLSWTRDTNEETDHETFTRRLIAFRKAHPALRPAHFYSEADHNGNGVEQLSWFKPDGVQADSTYLDNPDNHVIAWRIDGTEFSDPASAIYIAYNGGSSDVNFTLPWPGFGKSWYHVTDTATWSEGPNTVANSDAEGFIGGENTVYGLEGRSVVLLIAK
ncbi:glycogen debranching protein [Azotobacter chroococcum]|uniref:glycogen debranching protein n=1 Tax=Azotobacter chroococcum TaxID=353 RepID=UPI001E2ED8FE|nr:isoamylase [Azotobacter chroococcum]